MIHYWQSVLNISFQFRFIMLIRSSAYFLHNISSLYRHSMSNTRYSPQHFFTTNSILSKYLLNLAGHWGLVDVVAELCTPVSPPTPSSTAGSTSGWRCWTTRTMSRWGSLSTLRRPWVTLCSPSCQR